jgi:hypothetical protein
MQGSRLSPLFGLLRLLCACLRVDGGEPSLKLVGIELTKLSSRRCWSDSQPHDSDDGYPSQRPLATRTPENHALPIPPIGFPPANV